MPVPDYDLHVFGLNLSGMGAAERAELGLTRPEVERVLRALGVRHPYIEAVVVRARNHVEAFVAAPLGSDVVRAWVAQLRRVRPDLLHPRRRSLHYHVVGAHAERHLFRLASGGYTEPAASDSIHTGLKSALGIAARCGTIGETLDALFVRGLGTAVQATRKPGPPSHHSLNPPRGVL